MALSPDANALTDDHRRRQAQLGAYMLGQLGQLWPKLDPARIQETREPWLRAVVALVGQGYTASATLAAAYLPAYRALESVPGKLPSVPLAVPDLERIISVAAYLGPIRHYERLRGGMDADQSWRISRDQTLAAGQQHVLNGGRDQTTRTVARDNRALGFARVASGSACAFCAMLASRGPAYGSARSAGFEAHPGCNCTAEPVYHDGPDAWPPRSRIFAAQYDEVTKGLSGQDKAVAFRRAHEGRAARGARPATGGGRTVDAARTASGRGRELGRAGGRVDRRGRRTADPTPADAISSAEAQLRALRTSRARLEARQAAGEEVATALKWQTDRLAALEAELGPETVARIAAESAPLEQAAATQAAGAARAAEAARAEAELAAKARAAAEQMATTRAEAEALEAAAVRAAEQQRAAEAARAAEDGADAVDEAGIPYRLTTDYLRFLEEEDPELDDLLSHCIARMDDANPLELRRWEDLELYLDYKQREAGILAQEGAVADDVISRELAELAATRGRVGLTHDEAELDLTQTAATTRPTRRQVQEEFAVYTEELYVRAQAATRGHLVNPKGRTAGIDARSLFAGDPRRVLRYGSEELLEFFETTRRVQWSEFYAERTGSEAFAQAAARQRRISEGISRDRNVIDLVTNREA